MVSGGVAPPRDAQRGGLIKQRRGRVGDYPP